MRTLDAFSAASCVVIENPAEGISELLPIIRQRGFQSRLCDPQQAFLRGQIQTQRFGMSPDLRSRLASDTRLWGVHDFS